MTKNEVYRQLEMVWPLDKLVEPPVPMLPHGYSLRLYQPGDEQRFYEVMALAGWHGWNDARLEPWLLRVLPAGWFMAIDDATNQIVATAMTIHNHTPLHAFGGELGWVACVPFHQGKGLGLAVAAACTTRLIQGYYRNIHLYSEDERLPALKTYLKLGYAPFLYSPEMTERWQVVCEQLQWPYTPEVWAQARSERY